jgi:hypothetical protein
MDQGSARPITSSFHSTSLTCVKYVPALVGASRYSTLNTDSSSSSRIARHFGGSHSTCSSTSPQAREAAPACGAPVRHRRQRRAGWQPRPGWHYARGPRREGRRPPRRLRDDRGGVVRAAGRHDRVRKPGPWRRANGHWIARRRSGSSPAMNTTTTVVAQDASLGAGWSPSSSHCGARDAGQRARHKQRRRRPAARADCLERVEHAVVSDGGAVHRALQRVGRPRGR